MSEIDTSAEAVERLAREHDLVRFTLSMKSPQHDKTAATLRALLAERAALRKALRAVEEWWLCDGQHKHEGAPPAIFAVRDALAEAQEEER
jgi:hypothetical protein